MFTPFFLATNSAARCWASLLPLPPVSMALGVYAAASTFTSGDGQEVIAEVFDEHRRELAFEGGHRWYDLKRRNMDVPKPDGLPTVRWYDYRILAPIPGKGAVGVEIPNRRRRTVYLREVLSAPQYDTSDAALKIPLGVDVVGQPFVADLTKMPHLLVAGATGSGKSVCLNAIITGLLFQHGPTTLQFVMVDPKMLELSAYNGIPHLVMPVVTESRKASRALRWAVSEMEKRYKLMATCGARNIAAYNDKVAAGEAPTAPGAETPPDRLSYVVVVVDELADLMLTAPQEIEEPIARLALRVTDQRGTLVLEGEAAVYRVLEA